MLWQVTVSPYALAASGTLTFALTVSNRFIVGSSSFKIIWIFHPGFLYGENAGQLKNKAFSGFGGDDGEENCKNTIETGLWDREKNRIDMTIRRQHDFAFITYPFNLPFA